MKKGLSEIIRNASNKHWVEQLVEQALETKIRPYQSTESFHPSWSGDCQRLIQLRMFGLLKSDVNYLSQRIFDNGNSVHERYCQYFKTAKKLFKEEVPFLLEYKNITISGRADIILLDFENKKHIGEMKSINDRRFNEVLISNSPRDEHFLQWNIYSKGLNIQDGFILYENKNDQRILIFPVVFNEDKFVQMMNKFCFIEDCSNQGKLVPKPQPCPDGRFCPARSFCKNEDEGQKMFSDEIDKVMLGKLGRVK